nr:SGNH/GDSL hydrolase family protein [Nocardioides panacis]
MWGGTGFTFGGGVSGEAGQDYLTRVRALAGTPTQFNVVVLEGGQNDLRADRSQLLRDTGQVIAAVHEAWPGAVIIVLGPCAPQPLQHVLADTAAAIDAAARAAGAYSVNPAARKWFTDANSPGYDFDHTHVNSAGHAYIAQRLVQAVRTMRQISPS